MLLSQRPARHPARRSSGPSRCPRAPERSRIQSGSWALLSKSRERILAISRLRVNVDFRRPRRAGGQRARAQARCRACRRGRSGIAGGGHGDASRPPNVLRRRRRGEARAGALRAGHEGRTPGYRQSRDDRNGRPDRGGVRTPGSGCTARAVGPVFRGREGHREDPPVVRGIVTGVFGLDQRRVAHRLAQRAAPAAPAGRRPPARRPRISRAATAFRRGAPSTDDRDRRVRRRFLPRRHPTGSVARMAGRLPPIEHRAGRTPAAADPRADRALSGRPAAVPALGESHEVMMDVQIVAGLCPKANIRCYFAPFDQKGLDRSARPCRLRSIPPLSRSVSAGASAED